MGHEDASLQNTQSVLPSAKIYKSDKKIPAKNQKERVVNAAVTSKLDYCNYSMVPAKKTSNVCSAYKILHAAID